MKKSNQWEVKMVNAVSAKLGVEARLSGWRKEQNGSDTPIFDVPVTHAEMAKALGLLIA